MGVKPIPEGYHTLTTVLAVEDASGAIDFYKQAFGAKERMRMDAPGGKIAERAPGCLEHFERPDDPLPVRRIETLRLRLTQFLENGM